MEQRAIVIVAGVGLIAALLYVYWKQPHDYDDCILKTMTGVTSREAARAIETSCRAKFPPIAAQASSVREWEDVPAASIASSDPSLAPASKTAPDTRALAPQELAKLTGRAGKRLNSDLFSGSLYNGNDNLRISEIEIEVTTTKQTAEDCPPDWARDPKRKPIPLDCIPDSRSYVIQKTIPPKTVGNFYFNFIAGDAGASYSWQVVSAKGYKSED